MILGSKLHTVGDTRRWTVVYDKWLGNTATIAQVNVTSSSITCTISTPVPTILGTDVVFYLTGGTLGEQVTVTLKLTDSQGNVKNDTVKFTVIAP